jgi:hypothetical protein
VLSEFRGTKVADGHVAPCIVIRRWTECCGVFSVPGEIVVAKDGWPMAERRCDGDSGSRIQR